jgi:hypothetical protein
MGTNAEKRSPIREKPLRLPGQGLDERLRDLVFEDGLGYILPAAFAWMVAVGSLAQSFINRPLAYWLFSGVAIALTIRMAYGIWRIRKHAHRLRLGRAGERTVGQILQTIDLPGTRVFHDIPSEHGYIDHVVVCDRGVYVIETKTWSKGSGDTLDVKDGRILLRGRPMLGNPVGQAAAAAKWLSSMLAAETGHIYMCQAVVVLPGWFVGRMDAATKEQAWVLEPKALLKWIPQDPVKLRPEDIRQIEGAIARHVRRSIPDGCE